MVVDHKDNKFESESEMAKYWGVEPHSFGYRKRSGWTLKECLEGRGDNSIYDHKGNKFKTKKRCLNTGK